MTAATLAAVFIARAISDARLELGWLVGPVAAHWVWRSAVWAASDGPPWERPERVLAGVRDALELATGGGWMVPAGGPAWERRPNAKRPAP
jgi:hypothetical protein